MPGGRTWFAVLLFSSLVFPIELMSDGSYSPVSF